MYNGSYQSYGQGSYPPPPVANYGGPVQAAPQFYPSPAPAAPYYQQPDPALQVATDPNAFALMFKAQLASLTFNSKPIITNLTILSHEHVQRMSQVVARCLEEHVLTCSPSYRLPALYTIDSICKNVGQPYTIMWSDRILRMFMETYRVVDHSVKGRMEELLSTWRNSGAGGRPLFGDEAQYNIERALFGNAGPPVATPAFHQAPVQASNINSLHFDQNQQFIARTIERFDRLLALGSHDQHHNPHLYDLDRMQALAKLRLLVTETTLSGEDLRQIHSQLDLLEAEFEARKQTAAVQQHSQPVHHHLLQTVESPRLNGQRPANIPPSLAGALANLGKMGMGSSTPPVGHRPASLVASAATTEASTPDPAAGNAASAENLIASLRMAGLLPSSSQIAPPLPKVDQQDLEYSNMIMSLDIKLTTADMLREIPLGSLQAINFKELPLQCRQCANRYPSGVKGQASMDQHLDWHFRQNRRAKDSAARGQSRSWFSRLEEWVRGGHDDDTPSARAAEGHSSTGGGRAAVAMTPAQEMELKAATVAFVIAPSDDPGVMTKPCPICKELFQSEWSEDEEEWIWKNAVKVNDTYYHGSCHYSAKVLSTSVKQLQQSGGSREGTPLIDTLSPKVSSTRVHQIKTEERSQAPSIAGVKRKAEEEDGDENDKGKETGSKISKQSTPLIKEEP
ncbi:hypothetical protein CBS101457_001278 [Exobasidium rhododendri]|nr:hypothetical protein CBS101457_001278 [Exobasidium rhododendri]